MQFHGVDKISVVCSISGRMNLGGCVQVRFSLFLSGIAHFAVSVFFFDRSIVVLSQEIIP